MSVSYTRSDSVGRAIIPAPLVTMRKTYQNNGDGTKRGTNYSITLTGTLLPFRGSPKAIYSSLDQAFSTTGGSFPDEVITGNNEDFNHILRKQEALRWLFSEDGGSLEWQPANGQPPVKCYPRIISINFDQGQWANRNNYTIELEAPWVFINGTQQLEDDISTDLVASSNETWAFEEINGSDRNQQRVVHEVSAQGKLGYDGVGNLYGSKLAWQHAKDFVNLRVNGSIDSTVLTAVIGTTTSFAGRYRKTVKIDKDAGNYSVTEEWTLSDNVSYIDQQFTVDYDKNDDTYTVTYQGVIHGVGANTKDGDILNVLIANSKIPSDNNARTTALQFVAPIISPKTLPFTISKKSFAVNEQDGTTNFTFEWRTLGDTGTASAISSETMRLAINSDTLVETLTYSQSVEGHGDSLIERLTNASALINTESIALQIAKSRMGSGSEFNLISRVSSTDEKASIMTKSFTWTTQDANTVSINIQTQEPASVLAIIPIPGRINGPIIQNMNTKTSKIITVTMRSKRNFITQPNLDTSIFSQSGLLISDSNSWNPITGVAERISKFIVEI